MTLDELFKTSPTIEALYQEAQLELTRKQPADFCPYHHLWLGTPGDRGKVGLRWLLTNSKFPTGEPCVPLALQEEAARRIQDLLPGCSFTATDVYTHVDDGTLCPDHGECGRKCYCEPKAGCTQMFPTPPPTTEPGWESLTRNLGPVGVGSLIERLRDAAAKTSTTTWIDGSNVPDDANEPVFVVMDNGDARQLYLDMQISDRLRRGEITRWYAYNCVYVMDPRARKAVLGLKGPEDVTGPLSWKPVVLTFRDSDVEARLQRCCTQVVTIEPDKNGVWSLDKVHDAVKLLIAEQKVGIEDMPEEVLDGWLGRLCKERMGAFPIAFSWPALLSVASVLVPHSPTPSNRTNLFVALVGGKGTGKTSAFDYAIRLLDLKVPALLKLKAGSGEGLTKEIGDVGGASRLYFTDELAHLLLKLTIQGSAFATILNTIFYEDQQDLILAKNAKVNFNCRLSVAGGVVDEMFNDLFGAATTGGFYDRFIFGVAPSGYAYKYRAFTGEPALRTPDLAEPEEVFGTERPVPVEIDNDVWDARDRIAEELKLTAADSRLLELGLRAALIAASMDGRRTLHGADLGPMKAFIAYQINVRKRFKPNPGKNPEAIVACKVTDYLADHQGDSDGWISQRDMFRSTHVVIDWGPSIVNRALASLEVCGDIELSKNGRVKVVRKVKR